LESVLAGDNDDGGIQCDRTTAALVHRLGSGWRRQQRSGPLSLATESKFVIFRVLIRLIFTLYIGPFFVLIIVEFVIVGQ
jgi:hypothetical protein